MEKVTVKISISRNAASELYDVIGRLLAHYNNGKTYECPERSFVYLAERPIIFDVEARAMTELQKQLYDYR